ncbi:type II toxin-antitoxin system VapC family toxin [Glaciibacter superstes]|uniref:type II toxin-antitoxin system VapC family toxin n=1 Tax=Glaciibacter superstes TaxID=501023 RepID=UPI0003B72B7A|nr:type II toxin-antitoxin system VapC family toxin [Glaciibacter superstes]
MIEPLGFLIDSNVLLDIINRDPVWAEWSESALADATRRGEVWINPIVYSEVSLAFDSIDATDAALPSDTLRRAPLPWPAGFLAARAHQDYRKRGGTRASTLPDFFIGAHAVVSRFTLITRDARRYRTAFPSLQLVTPGA